MNTIKFSHYYAKMPNNYSPSRLLQIFEGDSANVSDDLREYDTKYLAKEGTAYYKLPTGKILILLLLTERGDLWTTIRRYTPRKYEYYLSKVGEMFSIEVVE
jgi:outer membrane lipoprotein-sorting protein